MYLPALRLSSQVEFLVDTGADSTSLLPYDVGRMGIDLRAVEGGYRNADGVGGKTRYKTTKAVLRFQDTAALSGSCEFEIDVDLIAEEADDQLPSLLGRDILNRCRCTFDAASGSVVLEPL